MSIFPTICNYLYLFQLRDCESGSIIHLFFPKITLLGQIRKCIFWSIEILPSNANPFLPFCLVFLIFLAFFIYHDRLWRIGCSNMSFPWLIPFRAANHPLPFRFIFCLFAFFWLKMTFWLCTFVFTFFLRFATLNDFKWKV